MFWSRPQQLTPPGEPEHPRAQSDSQCGHCWPSQPAELLGAFDDERFRELGERIIAGERCDLLSDQKSRLWETWRRDRLLADGGVPWLTITDARAEIIALMDNASPQQRRRLAEIQPFLADVLSRQSYGLTRLTGHRPDATSRHYV